VADRKSRKHASGPRTARGSTSKFADRERESAVKMAEELQKDGRSVTQASAEAGAAYRVAARTVQRWAVSLGRPLSQGIQEAAKARTRASRAARHQYTGADYRRAANELMHYTTLDLERYKQLHEELKDNDDLDLLMSLRGKLQLGLARVMQAEKALLELGHGIDPAASPDADDDGEVLSLEEQVAQARALRAQMEADGAAKLAGEGV
jgi:hypothetical protein